MNKLLPIIGLLLLTSGCSEAVNPQARAMDLCEKQGGVINYSGFTGSVECILPTSK